MPDDGRKRARRDEFRAVIRDPVAPATQIGGHRDNASGWGAVQQLIQFTEEIHSPTLSTLTL